MENKDLMIYNAVANVAARVFASFDAVMFQPGKYDVPAVLNRIKSVKAFQDENAETAANEIVKIEIDTFTCSFRAVDSFELLKRLAAAYQIPTACRAQFTKKADAAPVAVSFRVFAGLKDLCSRISKDILHPCFNYICVDTKRRALIVCDQYTLSAVPVPEMYVSEDAKETYLITPAVLKAGHGVCNIDTNGTATNGAAVSAVDEEIRYPNISRVLFAVPSEFITLGKKVFSELKKNVSAAAKFGKTDNTPVILKADAGANEIEIIGYRESETETNAPQETRRAVVSLPQPVPFAFAVAVSADSLGKVLSAEKMYLKDPNAPVCFVDETRRVFSVMYPGKDLFKTPFFNSAFEISVPAGALSVDAVAGTFAPVQDAPAAPFEDEETAPAVPAVSEETKITYITKNYVPVITDEIKNAVAVAALYKYIPYYENKYGVRCSREHTANIRLAELLLQRENLYIENYALICGNGQTFAYISKHDEEINVNYDVAQDEETANVETPAVDAPAVQDEETAAPVPEDAQETPAVADSVPAANDIETLINNKFAAYLNDAPAVADSVPAEDETAPAVPAVITPADNLRWAFENGLITEKEYICTVWNVAVYDENGFDITAPAAHTDMKNNFAPVAVWYAVYNSENVLHGVYFSKLLADEIVINSLFAAGNTWNVSAVQDAQAVPAVYPCPFAAVAVNSVSAVQDEETPAADILPAFASVFACMPEIWETAAPVADSVSAVAAEDAPAVQDEETANVQDEETAAPVAVLINSPRCFSLRPWLIRAAAVAAVIILSVFASWERETPAVAADSLYFAADSVSAVPADSLPADSVSAAEDAPETPAVAVADSVPADSLYFAADSVSAVAVSDSVPADSVPAVLFAADSLANVPAVDEETANVQDETAPAVQDAPDVANAAPADSVPAVDEETPAPADSVPAANSPAPAVPAAVPVAAVSGCPAVPAVALCPYVIACFGN